MAKIPEIYNIGSNEDVTLEKLLDIMLDMYKDIAIQLNKKPDVYERASDGLSSDTMLSIGDVNINTITGKTQTLLSHPSTTEVTWSSGDEGNSSAFLATLRTQDLNATGDGIEARLGSGNPMTIIYDQNGDFNPNGTFTAPVTSRYLLIANVQLGNFTAAHTKGLLIISTPKRLYRTNFCNPAACRGFANNSYIMTGSALADMDEGETATVSVYVDNGARQISVQSDPAIAVTYFSGKLIG